MGLPHGFAAAASAALLLSFVTLGCGGPPERGGEVSGHVVEQEVLLQLSADLEPDDTAALRALHERYGVEHLEPVGGGWVRARYAAAASPDEVARDYGRLDEVAAAQPNIVYQPDAIPTDPRFADQYSHEITEAAAGWDVTTGSRSVVVAILGEGVDVDHPDLAANIWRNPGEVAGDGIDNDQNGFVDDVNGWDFAAGDNDPRTAEHHETAVAGVVGAVGGNGQGIAGVAWAVSLMPIRVETVSADVARAIDYAVANGASVINMSFSSPTGFRDAMVTSALARAEAAGVVAVASVGNLNNDEPRYPAAFPDVVGVAATDRNDRRASYSCYGAWVDVAAPGDAVLTTYPGGRYDTAGGTSFAAPYVAGVAALLRARDPGLSAAAIRSILTTSGDVISTDRYIGETRINVRKAIGAPAPDPDPAPSPGDLGLVVEDFRGNNWWLEVWVGANEPLASVEVRIDGGSWIALGSTAWGPWVGGVRMPDGSVLELRATGESGAQELSVPYLWPDGTPVDAPPAVEPPPPAPAPGALGLVVEDLRGNNWWLEALLSASEPLASVEVRVDGGSWIALRSTTWGPWVGGVRMPDGSVLELRATGESGAQELSVPYLWPDGTPALEPAPPPPPPEEPQPPPDPFDATFTNLRGNSWWVEADVTATGPLASVDARVDAGSWRPLSPTDWGSWAASFFVPSGALVELRATSTGGAEVLSPAYAWPP